MGNSVCQITINTDRPRIRIEGDYVKSFYEQLKEIIPKPNRSYIDGGKNCKYWLVDKEHFCRVMELAYEHFSWVHLFENGRADRFETHKEEIKTMKG